MRTLLVALHDVTPAHAGQLDKAERLLTKLGVPRVTYLFVPRFHGGAPAHMSRDFAAWCHAARPFDVQWFLHGYFHDECTQPAPCSRRASVSEWWGSSVVTAQEAEFLRLRGVALRLRLSAGMLSFEACLGSPPDGFVAPGWLFNDELVAVLSDLRFQFTESPFRIIQIAQRRAVRSPVLTWATRTVLRKHGSLAAAAIRRSALRRQPIVRVAIHPNDLDDEQVVASIGRTLDVLRRDREVTAYSDALFGDAATVPSAR